MTGHAAVTPDNDSRIPPRARILAAAGELFYRHGIRAVGVDAIAEAAATNKMTLYRHFGSKDELVASYLSELAKDGDAFWEKLAATYPGNPQAQIDGWVRHVEEIFANRVDRGCAVANAAVELRETQHPGRQIIEDYKTRKRDRLVALFREAGYTEPASLAD